QGRHHVSADGKRTSRLTGDGHSAGIAAETGDVLLHPTQRGVLIEKSIIARRFVRRLPSQLRQREEAEYAQPVVDGDDDDALAGHALAVVAGFRPVAAYEATAIKINQHGKPFSIRPGGRPDVEIETVFTHAV